MPPRTFVEKIFNASQGSIVFRCPDIVLSHDNTASIYKTFLKMGGTGILYPDRLLIVLDHNAPPTNARLANDYQSVRELVREQGIQKFYDAGSGICHQIMSAHARPGMLVVGSDSHTCTAGAFNAMAAGIDRTETAGIWKRGETWFRVPESMKITLSGRLREGVFAKDLSLWIIGMIGSAGANYLSIEFHGDGVENLGISDRMTLANLASEMGAKNAVFPCDKILKDFVGNKECEGVWADEGAVYLRELEVELDEVIPLLAVPHQVDRVVPLAGLVGTPVQQGLIGTCTNGRIEDLRIAAEILKGKVVAEDFQLLITPASREVYLQAVNEGLVAVFLEAGATILTASCGPCLGTGQGIPADNTSVISTANRNFLGRMGNPNASIYLASPASVAYSAVTGTISNPASGTLSDPLPFVEKKSSLVSISGGDNRNVNGVWNYADIDNLNTDQMFAGKLTYDILSSDPGAIIPHLFKDFDAAFAGNLAAGDVIVGGDNFGCGSSREHPAAGLAHAGVAAIIVKSVNRIFYRASVNQGLLLLVLPEFVGEYKQGDTIRILPAEGRILLNDKVFNMAPLPEKLSAILKSKGLVRWMLEADHS